MALVEDDWGEVTASFSKSQVLRFLEAAVKRLPSQAAIDRDKARKVKKDN